VQTIITHVFFVADDMRVAKNEEASVLPHYYRPFSSFCVARSHRMIWAIEENRNCKLSKVKSSTK